MSYVLGIDLGTSSLKGLLVNKSGKIIDSKTSNYTIINPKPGYSEQNPDHWIEAFKHVIDQLNQSVDDFSKKLVGISFSGQMHSLVLLGQDNKVVRNSILWNDTRTTVECKEIMQDFGDELLSITKNIALEGFTLPKILWVQKNEPENWQKTRHVLLPKDYLRYWCDGQLNMDYSDAAGTLLLDLEKRQWSEPILKKYKIDKQKLPKLVNSHNQTGVLRKEIQEEFGFFNEVKIFAGGADNACSALGAGIIDSNTALASIGTSGVFLTPEVNSDVVAEGSVHLFNHVLEDMFYSMGVTLSAGASLEWFRKTFAESLSYEELLKDVSEVKAGSNGLLFSPYLVGERTPHNDSQIRGSFTGIDISHTRDHFAKAVLEGITFSLKDSQSIMEQSANKKVDKVISVGGGAKNDDWLQIQADIFNLPITTIEAEEGPGLGAAMLATLGLGWFENVSECISVFVRYSGVTLPNPKNVEIYKDVYKQYKKVYSNTKRIIGGKE